MKQFFLIFIFLINFFQLMADPWGKDADLVHQNHIKCSEIKRCTTPLLGPVAETLICFHKRVLSPADGPRSHFRPNSSQYMLDAIRKYGFFKGFPLGCDRLMRENNDPWIYRSTTDDHGVWIKVDPVR